MAPLSARGARRALSEVSDRDPELYALVLALAPAARVERPLLRAARRLAAPRAGPALEARFWWSPLVGSRGAAAVTLHAEAASAARDALCEQGVSWDDARLALVREMHSAASAGQRLEERLVAHALVRDETWRAETARELQSALRALLDDRTSAAGADLARWMAWALPRHRMPRGAARRAARDLFTAACLRLGRAPEDAGPLAAPAVLPAWLAGAAPDGGEAVRHVAVRWGVVQTPRGDDSPVSIYIAYNHALLPLANTLSERLLSRGLQVVRVAPSPTSYTARTVRELLAKADVCIALFSGPQPLSTFLKMEIQEAMRLGKRLLPTWIGDRGEFSAWLERAPRWLRASSFAVSASAEEAAAILDATLPREPAAEPTLFLDPSLDAGCRHVLPLPAGLPPVLRVDALGPSARVQAHRPAAVPLGPGAVAATLAAADGCTWRVEDADAADAHPPLRVFVAVVPEDRAEFAGMLSAVEDALRRGVGLPRAAPVVLRSARFDHPSGEDMRFDRSTWRGAQPEMLREASVVLVVATPRLVDTRGRWEWELLERIWERSAGGRELEGVLVLGPSEGAEMLRGAPEVPFRWLSQAKWLPPSSGAEGVAEAILGRWRLAPLPHRTTEGKTLADADVDSRESGRILADCLQELTQVLAGGGVYPGFGADGLDVSNSRAWGFGTLPGAGRYAAPARPNEQRVPPSRSAEAATRRAVAGDPSAPDEVLATLASDEDPAVRRAAAANPSAGLDLLARMSRDPDAAVRRAVAAHPAVPSGALAELKRDPDQEVRAAAAARPAASAEEDFVHVREAGRAVFVMAKNFLEERYDPFAPRCTAAELGDALASDRFPGRRPLGDLGLRAFARFADAASLQAFTAEFGDPGELADARLQGHRAAPQRADAIARCVQRFEADIYDMFLRWPSTLAACTTFPEYVEGFLGLLLHYLRSLAGVAPDAVAVVRQELPTEAVTLMNEAFRSCFVWSAQGARRLPEDLGSEIPERGLALDVSAFADLVAGVGASLAWSLRSEVRRRRASAHQERSWPSAGMGRTLG